jgi:hypothetical protein
LPHNLQPPQRPLQKTQNSGRGRSPPRSTAKAAVHSGNKPTNTMECAEVTCCSASAVNNGNPTTTPAAVIASDGRSANDGRRSAKAAAARPKALQLQRVHVRNVGFKSATATRVARQRSGKDGDANHPVDPSASTFLHSRLLNQALSTS